MAEEYNCDKEIIEYCSELAKEAHKDMTRDTGEPYFLHPQEVACLVDKLLLKTRFKEAGVAAAYLHDVVEDVEEFDVCHPPGEIFKMFLPSDKTYINNLLLAAGDTGNKICYILDKVTLRDSTSYAEYMDKIFSMFPSRGYMRSLDIISLVLKFADRTVNCLPGEVLNKRVLLAEYRKLENANAAELSKFYKKKKVTDTFIAKNGICYDEELYLYAMDDKFESKKVANALDNVLCYIPEIDKLLLQDDVDNIAGVGEDEIYDKKKLDELVDKCLFNSMNIIEQADLSDSLKLVHVLYKTANYRGVTSTSMQRLKKLRHKLREKKDVPS
ncbi:MAG: HD domain-containing protein [Candidatus Woesearchaeota archaeon]